ncbi:hypothetical protein LI064_16740 [Clostridium perfringens]|uniref:hypothetical protein n=1 Tax=Clostridium perfringens TaxID=1502 RepID=UPI0022460BA7|nr:hypothetical protein [Clostridium perfringens]MCX0356158.1 hypothetical protein [Clostridium perfringens]
MKKKILGLLVVGVLSLGLVGCGGSLENKLASGSIFKTKGNYVVINYSGGKIFDVWTLENAYVQNSSNSDGYEFVDDNGNFVTVSGDVLVIRCNDNMEFNKYKEFHEAIKE